MFDMKRCPECRHELTPQEQSQGECNACGYIETGDEAMEEMNNDFNEDDIEEG